MTKIRFAGKKKELKEFTDFLARAWGKDQEIVDLPDIVCGSDGQSTRTSSGAPLGTKVTETLVI